jgi:hypothetical protein
MSYTATQPTLGVDTGLRLKMPQAEREGKRGVRLCKERIVKGAGQNDGTRTARSHVGERCRSGTLGPRRA